MIKLHHYEDIKRTLNKVINFVDTNDTDDIEFFKVLSRKVNNSSRITEEQFAVLYYLTLMIHNIENQDEPKVIITTYEDAADVIDRFKVPSEKTEKVLKELYVSLLLTKPNGIEYGRGSLKFSEEQYKEMDNNLKQELRDMQPVAEKYIKSLIGKQVRI